MINISGTLFENERPKPSGPAVWKIALVVTVAVLMTFGATWLFFRPSKGRAKPVPLSATQLSPAPATPQATVGAVPPPPVPPAVPLQQTPASGSSAPTQVSPAMPPTYSSKPLKAVVQAASSNEDDDERRESHRRKNVMNEQSLPTDQVTAAPADIKLSGIAWQEERRARRAVVNGFLMQEGAVVSGARITDIFQNRVRFSLSGKTFEIPLISSTVPAAGK